MTPERAKEITDQHDHLESEKAESQRVNDELAKTACSDTYSITAQEKGNE
jgi:hypothetical protein